MRLAICLSGQPRTWRHTCESLLHFFGEHEIEVFIHTWDDIDVAELADVKAAYSPRAVALENRPEFLQEKRAMAARFPQSPPLRVFDMVHSMTASVTLALEACAVSNPYDLICRTRFDTIYDGRWSGHAPPRGVLAVQTGEYEPEGGCNDQFALGDPQAMRLYAGVSAWLPQGMLSLPPPSFREEIALQAYLLQTCGLVLRRERFALTLLRSDQVGRPFSALKDDPLHHARKREDSEAFANANMSPEIIAKLDFSHYGRLPLMLDNWLQSKPDAVRRAVLTSDWPNRIVAIDRLLQEETGGGQMDADRYRLVRLVNAATINRMARNEPMGLESFIVHALSANLQDMQKALEWAQEDRTRVAALDPILDRLPTLGAACRFAQPFDQAPMVGWRALD